MRCNDGIIADFLGRKGRGIIVFLLCLLMQGCTRNLWLNALSKDIYFSQVSGIAVKKNGSSESLSYMYVTYAKQFQTGLESSFTYAIQVGGDSVPECFDYTGSQRSLHGIINDISKDRLSFIKNYILYDESITLEAIPPREAIRWIPFFPSPLFSDRSREKFSVDNVIIFPYTLNKNDIDSKEKYKKGFFDPPVNPHYRYLILPQKIELKPYERSIEILFAGLVTPITLTFDAFIGALQVISGG